MAAMETENAERTTDLIAVIARDRNEIARDLKTYEPRFTRKNANPKIDN